MFDGHAATPVPVQPLKWWEQAKQFTEHARVAQSNLLKGRKVARGQYLLQDCVLIGTKEGIREVLVDHDAKFRNTFPKGILQTIGHNQLLALDGPRHFDMRNLLQPAFTSDKILQHLPTIQKIAEKRLQTWHSLGVQRAVPQLKLFSFEIICNVFGGLLLPDEQLEGMMQDLLVMVAYWMLPDFPLSPYRKSLAARERVLAIVRPHIQSLLQASQEEAVATSALAPNNGCTGGSNDRASPPHGSTATHTGVSTAHPQRSILQSLVMGTTREGWRLSEDEMVDNFFLMLLAGHGTVGTTLALAAKHMMKYPHVMQRLREEHMQLEAQHGGAITAECLKQMPFTEAVIKEVWRMDTLFSILFRTAKEDVVVEGHLIPKGTLVITANRNAMHTQDPWDGTEGNLHPEVFNPDRWLQPGAPKWSPLLTFGGGSHACLGIHLAWVESKVMLAVLARKYQIEVLGGNEWHVLFNMVCKDGMPAVLHQL